MSKFSSRFDSDIFLFKLDSSRFDSDISLFKLDSYRFLSDNSLLVPGKSHKTFVIIL